MINRFDSGEGLAGTIFTDTLLTSTLDSSLLMLQQASDRALDIVENLESVVINLKEGEGTAGLILADTTLRNKLLRSAGNIEQGTYRFNENMKAMKSNFLFKGYFKKQEKEERKKSKSDM